MQYFINRDGEEFGPYETQEVLDHLKAGTLRYDDRAWHEGMSDWKPLAEALGLLDRPPAEQTAPAAKIVRAVPRQPAPVYRPPSASAPVAGKTAGSKNLLIAGAALCVIAIVAGYTLGKGSRGNNTVPSPQAANQPSQPAPASSDWLKDSEKNAPAPASTVEAKPASTPDEPAAPTTPAIAATQPGGPGADASAIAQAAPQETPVATAPPEPPVAESAPARPVPPAPAATAPTYAQAAPARAATPRTLPMALPTPWVAPQPAVPVAQPFVPVAPAAGDPNKHSVTLEVKSLTAGSGAATTSGQYVYGSSTTYTKAQKINIHVRNLKHEPDEVEVEWFFFGKPATGNKRFMYDKGIKKLAIKAGGWEDTQVTSKELESKVYNYDTTNQYKRGQKAEGWIVRVKAGEKIIALQASSATLEDLAKNPGEFESVLKAPVPPGLSD
jgi:uncharacterized protein DUF4339